MKSSLLFYVGHGLQLIGLISVGLCLFLGVSKGGYGKFEWIQLVTGSLIFYLGRGLKMGHGHGMKSLLLFALLSWPSFSWGQASLDDLLEDPCWLPSAPVDPVRSLIWKSSIVERGFDLRVSTKFRKVFFKSGKEDDCGLDPIERMMAQWNRAGGFPYFNLPVEETENKELENMEDYQDDDVMGIYLITNWYKGKKHRDTLAVTIRKINALTGKVTHSDILVNGTMQFRRTLITGRGTYDLYSVLLHELGHFLGLGHVARDKSSLMVPSLNWSFRKREVTPLDKANLGRLYRWEPLKPSPGEFEQTGEEVTEKLYLKGDGRCSHYEEGEFVGEHYLF